ncbi:MAG: YebC/PmpR family DNA-binding transcriptional regulator, partial [Thermomicrobiales bacterium]|nr:YebC/PmpR family DNA-binding transcriptional regulator [Thermomicrobiales bacterium]
MSGHSKWATIKRQKGANDQKRGQLFTKLGREIAVAVRAGGPDPEANFRLRLAIQKARAENMPKDNIDRAIERASGAGNTDNFDEVSYEGYGPGGVAVVIQALTDNRNRTVGEVRSALTRAGGSLGESGSVAWMFDNVGLISVEADGQDPEEIALVAIDAGAEDVSIDDDGIEVYTEVQNLHVVQDALVSAGINVNSADPVMKPKATV